MNPSLLLGPGDDRLSSTRPILQFLAREISLMPAGGLNVVDARDVAALLPVAMARGTAGARYLLGAVNWTFAEFFGRLERLTKIAGPKLKFSGDFPFLAARAQAAVYKKLGRKVPVEPESVEMAQYFWYLDAGKAARELGFAPARSRRHAARHRQLHPRAPARQRRVQERRDPHGASRLQDLGQRLRVIAGRRSRSCPRAPRAPPAGRPAFARSPRCRRTRPGGHVRFHLDEAPDVQAPAAPSRDHDRHVAALVIRAGAGLADPDDDAPIQQRSAAQRDRAHAIEQRRELLRVPASATSRTRCRVGGGVVELIAL